MIAYLKMAGLLTIGLSVSAAYFYVYGLQDENAELVASNTQLNANIVQLETQIKHLHLAADQKREERKSLIEELKTLRAADQIARKEVIALKSKLNEQQKQRQLDLVSRSRGASLHLAKVNKGAKCQWQHFSDFEGKCVGEKWREEKENTDEN